MYSNHNGFSFWLYFLCCCMLKLISPEAGLSSYMWFVLNLLKLFSSQCASFYAHYTRLCLTSTSFGWFRMFSIIVMSLNLLVKISNVDLIEYPHQRIHLGLLLFSVRINRGLPVLHNGTVKYYIPFTYFFNGMRYPLHISTMVWDCLLSA